MKSYEELKQENKKLEQENFEACGIMLDFQIYGAELDKRVRELLNKMMPLEALKSSTETEEPHH